MKTSHTLEILAPLLKRPYFTSIEARNLGIPSYSLSYYVKTGRLKRISRGVYQVAEFKGSVNFRWEDLIEAVYSISGGVICLVSALDIYNLTEEMPRQHWIAISNTTTAKRNSNIKIMRYRNMNLGKTEINIEGVKVAIFDRERCIIDAFRLLSKETAIKSLKMGLELPKDEKINLVKLQDYAKKLRVNISPYLIAMIT
jgi:predicted transcriptional regulator of viral defense system